MPIYTISDSDEVPGLRDFEVNFLRLVDALTQGTRVEINETGTSLRFHPGLPNGGTIEHDCGIGRSIGWYVRVLLHRRSLHFLSHSSRPHLAGL